MKRKFVSFAALTMALTLAFGMTVSAAGSTSTASSNVTQETLDAAAASAKTSAVVDDQGNKVEAAVEATVISRENVGAAEQAAATKLPETLTQKAGGLVTGFDLKVTLADGKEAKNVTVQLAVPGVETGHEYRVLHWTGSDWEVIAPNAVAKGSLTVTFASLSPIVIIEVAAKDTGSNSGSGDNGNSGASAPAADVSPKTGETLPMAGTAVLLCLAGAAVCAKKARI